MQSKTDTTKQSITSSNQQQALLAEVKSFCAQKNWQKASQIASAGVKQFPQLLELWLLLTQIYQQQVEFDLMCQAADQMLFFHMDNAVAQIRNMQCLIYAGEIAAAIKAADQMLKKAAGKDQLLSKLAEVYLHLGQHQKVYTCHKQALDRQLNNHQYRYNLAAACVSLGQFEQSAKLLMQLITDYPQDFDAYYMLSGLAKVQKESNHIPLLQQKLAQYQNQDLALVSLNYALGKEYEDLGEYEKAFEHFERGANARLKKLSYQVATDLAAIKCIKQVFSKKNKGQSNKIIDLSSQQQSPIFILGLPRSGTTLVESLLTSHSKVGSLGEVNSFAFALMHQVGSHENKLDLIEKSAQINFAELGQKYQYATRGYGVEGQFLIDKTPLNYLYIGLIRQSLPNAKIIHLKRHPLDACFAMYKTLFRMGYPFSYDLSDLAMYYAAYQDLMDHWQQQYPDQILNLHYQKLVDQPEAELKILCDYCGLDFESEMLNFYKHQKPVATASAAQVRQPIYTSSVNRWKRYQKQLLPLKQALQNLGVCCD